jgi:multidrug resistance protein MdtO
MAANAAEGHAAVRTNWLRLLAPDPERLEFATRLALVCALTTLVSEIYQTPDPALTTYIAFFVCRPERTESLMLSVVLTLVITVVIALIFLVASENAAMSAKCAGNSARSLRASSRVKNRIRRVGSLSMRT